MRCESDIAPDISVYCFLVNSTLCACSSIIFNTPSIVFTEILESPCNLLTAESIILVELVDCSASFLISSATTAKPFPFSPALAASIAAFNASKLVCSAIDVII